VRFVLERSLSKFKNGITIHSSHWKDDIKQLIDSKSIDLLITELSMVDTDGLEISQYARRSFPDMTIIWITVMGCHEFKEQKEALDIFQCIEKPLEIAEFRNDVIEALKA
jgi:DNA-binding NtrC family response regulator